MGRYPHYKDIPPFPTTSIFPLLVFLVLRSIQLRQSTLLFLLPQLRRTLPSFLLLLALPLPQVHLAHLFQLLVESLVAALLIDCSQLT